MPRVARTTSASAARAGVWSICGPSRPCHRSLKLLSRATVVWRCRPLLPNGGGCKEYRGRGCCRLSYMRGALGERTGPDELPYRDAVYGQGSGDAALGDALPVQFHHFTVTGIALLAALEGSALFSGGEHGGRARRLGYRGLDRCVCMTLWAACPRTA